MKAVFSSGNEPAEEVLRLQDRELQEALERRDSVVLVKGARGTGKTRLLLRGLRRAAEAGARVVATDLRTVPEADLESATSFYRALGERIGEQLNLPVRPAAVWNERRGPNVNFERYLRREVLAPMDAPFVWGLDEADRLFDCTFGGEVFGLFRSWHNERALDPAGPWSRLSLVIAYAGEAHLFITDMNQSPFNVGTKVVLEDFDLAQVAEVNRRFGSPLRTEEEIRSCESWLGGQPGLVSLALNELLKSGGSWAMLLEKGAAEGSVFEEHLRGLWSWLRRSPELMGAVQSVLAGQGGISSDSFYRLRSAGVVSGSSPADMRMRCELYASYLKRCLG